MQLSPSSGTESNYIRTFWIAVATRSCSNKKLTLSDKTLAGTKLESTFWRDLLTFLRSFSLLYSSATACDQETYQTLELCWPVHHLQPAWAWSEKTMFAYCLKPGTWCSPRPASLALGSVCASGHWFDPTLHRVSCSRSAQSQTLSCSGAVAALTLPLGTVLPEMWNIRHYHNHQ